MHEYDGTALQTACQVPRQDRCSGDTRRCCMREQQVQQQSQALFQGQFRLELDFRFRCQRFNTTLMLFKICHIIRHGQVAYIADIGGDNTCDFACSAVLHMTLGKPLEKQSVCTVGRCACVYENIRIKLNKVGKLFKIILDCAFSGSVAAAAG